MVIASSLAYRHGPPIVVLLASVAMALCVMALLAFVASLLDPGTIVPTLDGPRLAPFRWSPGDPDGTV
ncbi:MAG: hypothetical protein H0V04_04465 [Chloroflexi bacterium]|nr:hypothetical protein [Chloroflexota bacterium]